MLIPFQQLLSKYGIRPSGVFHIGASFGQEAPDYLSAGVHDVIFIEAIPTVYRKLKENIATYPAMIALNYCISDEDGKEITFHISNNEAQSSSMLEFGTHVNDHPEVKFVQDIKLQTTRVDTLLTKTGFDLADYNFLNIDLQGAELLALKSIGEQLNKVQYAYIEVNKQETYKGCPLLADIDAYMQQYGFKRTELQWCGNFGWGDAFYIK